MTNTPKSEASALAVVAWGYSDGQPDGTNLIALHRQPHYRNECALVRLTDARAIIDRMEREISDLRIEIDAGDNVINELHDEIASLESAQPGKP